MRALFTDHLPFKIAALVTSLTLYLFVMQERERERTFEVAVRVDAVPEGYVLLTEIPNLTVVVAGRARNLSGYYQERLRELRLSFSAPVSHRRFSASDFALPPGLQLRSISPDVIDLNFAPKVDADVEIIPDIRGEPAAGFNLTNAVSPETVHISGPASEINALEGVFTQPVDVTGLRSLTTRRVGLVQLGPNITYERSLSVLVTIRVETNYTTIQVSEVPLTISGPSDRFALDRSAVGLTLRGPETVIDNLDTEQLRASVDVTPFLELPAGEYDVEPRFLNLPPEVSVAHVDIETLRLTVTAAPTLVCRYLPFPNLLPIALPTLVVP